MGIPVSLRSEHRNLYRCRPRFSPHHRASIRCFGSRGFDFAQQEQTLKLLAIAFGGDPACTDCNRVLRVPGFLNRKYDPPYKVTVEYPDDSILDLPDDFQLDAGMVDTMHFASASSPCKPPLSAAIRNRIGLGFCMSLPTARAP